MNKTAIIYGSSTGNTQGVAETIGALINNSAIDIFNITDFLSETVSDYDNLILGTSTWGIGDLQDDWEDSLSALNDMDLSDKTVALFGLGDAVGYPDTFVDGIGILYEAIKNKGCNIVGQVETDKYNYDDSKAVIDGRFIGLPIDEDNESNLTSQRIKNWVDTIIPFLN